MKALNCFLRTCLVAASIICSTLAASHAVAQQDGSIVKTKDYEFRIGAANTETQTLRNSRRQSREHTVRSENARWIRINFKDVNLGAKSYLELYSPLDDATQILDAQTLAESNYSSAYFNGDEVRVVLHKLSGDRRPGVSIDSIEVGEQDRVTAFSQCGPNDDRVLSNDPAVGRIMPIGCTGWLIGNRKVLTAGHCISSRTQSLQFNVPLSTSGGGYVNPGPEDQYTIIQDSIKFRNNGPGNDWAVFEVRNNSQTGLHPTEAQGRIFNLVRDTNVDTIRITGHGVDSGNRNGVQQTHTGRFTSVSGTRLNYKVDTEGGNSGSPVIDEDTGNAIGIHTHGGCRTDGSGANSGTSTLNAAFWEEADPGVTPPPTDPDKVGITTVQPTRTTTANRRAMPFIMPASGSLSSITMYHSGGSGKMQLAVYADNNGLPGALLASSPEVETSGNTGWQTVQLQNTAAASEGQRIWLAWVYENNPGIFYDTGSPGRANINQTWSNSADNMPNSFGASTTANYRYSIYATFASDGGTANVGIETVGGQTSVNGSRRAMPFTMSESGQIESISIYHEGGNGGLILAAYADNNGAPGALLATSGSVSVSSASGWQSVALNSATRTLNSGQRVWLGWVFENNPGVRYVTGSPGRAQSDQSWGGGMPNSFGASGQADFRYSIYATYKKQ